MTKDKLKQRLYDWLLERPRNSYKTKELARALSVSKQGDEYQSMKTALRELQDEQKLDRIDGRKWALRRTTQEVVGTLEIAGNGHGFALTHEEPPRTIFIHRKNLHEAQGGDIVRVSVFPFAKGKNDEGEVSEVMGRPRKRLTGRVKRIKDFTFFEPDDERMTGDFMLHADTLHGADDGDVVVVEIPEEKGRRKKTASPEVVEVLGREGDRDTEMKALARRFGLNAEFPREVEQAASQIPSQISEEEIASRLDLRDLECFTIDPEDAKDFDDAVSLSVDSDGNFSLGVHIADVSHYVRPGTVIDIEAKNRATSVYLVNHVVPMLPERLSNHMCSLKEGKDRLTYSAIMTISPRGRLIGSEFRKTVIRSKKRFSYPEVQGILNSGEGPHYETLSRLDAFARMLTKKRIREGGIDFDMQEVQFAFDDGGNVVNVMPRERLQSMRMIEECMLMANKAVAEGVKDFGKALPFLYRVHDIPDPEKVRELTEFLGHLGIRIALNPRSSASFQKMLDSVRGESEEAVVNNMTVRSMAKAVYSEKNIGHFGLGFTHYTHFTSPIRRYPDLLVHRLLWDYQCGRNGDAKDKSRQRLKEMALHCSARERLAVDAERESVKLKQVEFMERHTGEVFDAVISGVTAYGMYVQIMPHLAEGLVHVRDMDDDYYEFDSRKKALIGQRRRKLYRLGDHVTVQAVRADRKELEIDFILAGKRR